LGIADFTATNGTSFTLATGAVTGDLIEAVQFTGTTTPGGVTSISVGSNLTTSGPTGAVTLNLAANPSVNSINLSGTATPANGLNNVATNSLGFFTNSAEAMRIDASGNLLVGNTSLNSSVNGNYFMFGGGITYISHINGTASTTRYCNFGYNGGEIGSITQNGTTAVAYNTSSDYRLKENIAPMTGALAKVQSLKPVTYKWKSDGSTGQGFIAHELAEVVPDCVTGEKDAVDEKGNPIHQGIDTSFLVATLTAAIKEQQAMIVSQATAIESQAADIAALKTKVGL
jgi:hypothetical protein